MKNLYHRCKLSAFESDRSKILNCSGAPEDVEAACFVLLNADRKTTYDSCCSVLNIVGRARKSMDVPTPGKWRNKYWDFLDVDDSDVVVGVKSGGETATKKKASASSPFGSKKLAFGMVASLAVLVVVMYYGDFLNISETPVVEKVILKEIYSRQAPVRAVADENAEVIGEFYRHDSVEVLVEKSTPKFDFVRTEQLTGFVKNEHLNIGNYEAEDLERCRQQGVSRPESGMVLTQLQKGEHRLKVMNPLAQDIVIKLKSRNNVDIVTLYMWGHEAYTFDSIPDGKFNLVYSNGKNYSPTCARFVDQVQAKGDYNELSFQSQEWAGDKNEAIEATYIIGDKSNRHYPIPPRFF